MSSTIIPKEQLSAYQRWELASLGDNRPSARQEAALAEQQAAEQLALLREEARRQGYEEGHAQGHQAGHAEGYAQGHAEALETAREALVAELAPVRKIAETFGSAIERATDTVASDMLELALDLAKAMLKTSLKVRPELVLPVVNEAIRYLPVVQQPALLALHPDDALVVTTHIGEELSRNGWRVTEDPHLERGGCRIETASNQIDASAEVRWQRIAEALGKHNGWLE
ncbi:flagellar assembly protein FliH [Noviherbaspirillum sp. CPCC 100848]|uniref:Flagellar assembly protein FliH n=1 Tax=Noviherbaspirillum album TaxID=3080276 RepID=A0ABU6JCI7_9BURK|nr:flagellar assembly protein FliH [Noviherbaspirillum sp. CPCC 100848]MEC4721354.1 flagellar assembly protein FliH [Noviherbaspirillum sp. CPCC 100848]